MRFFHNTTKLFAKKNGSPSKEINIKINQIIDENTKHKYWENQHQEQEISNELNHSSEKFWQDFGKEYMENSSYSKKLSHVNEAGEAKMVDVSDKKETKRTARASAKVYVNKETFELIKENKMKKGDVLGTAKIAGIMGAKRTWDLIPMCHPLPLENIVINTTLIEDFDGDDHIQIIAETVTTGRTGVEMEALTAVSLAALTIYDMCKAVSHNIIISEVQLESKTGGKKDFQR